MRLNPEKNKEKTNRIKTNNQELWIRKENESDATSLGIVTGNEKRRFHGKESSLGPRGAIYLKKAFMDRDLISQRIMVSQEPSVFTIG